MIPIQCFPFITKTLVIIAPELSQFQQSIKDLDIMLNAMENNMKVANINEEIHKVNQNSYIVMSLYNKDSSSGYCP